MRFGYNSTVHSIIPFSGFLVYTAGIYQVNVDLKHLTQLAIIFRKGSDTHHTTTISSYAKLKSCFKLIDGSRISYRSHYFTVIYSTVFHFSLLINLFQHEPVSGSDSGVKIHWNPKALSSGLEKFSFSFQLSAYSLH